MSLSDLVREVNVLKKRAANETLNAMVRNDAVKFLEHYSDYEHARNAVAYLRRLDENLKGGLYGFRKA